MSERDSGFNHCSFSSNCDHITSVQWSHNSCFDPCSSSVLCVPGAESDRGSQAACFTGGCQNCPSVVHQGPEDESHLSHSEPLQHRCHSEVSDCRDLVPCVRSRLHSVCAPSGHGEDTHSHIVQCFYKHTEILSQRRLASYSSGCYPV